MRTFKTPFFGLILVSIIVSFSSCGVNSNLMFKVPKGDLVYNDSVPMIPQTEYVIAPDDKIAFSLSTNQGEPLLEAIAGIGGGARNKRLEYVVKTDGNVDLPVIGDIKVNGLTVVECQNLLEQNYSSIYQEPFVQVEITNQRVLVFPGSGSDARVVGLANNNTTLMEVLAQAGGIRDRGKANTVKLMRKVNGTRKVYILDMSVIEGLKYADMIVQANDYIYVEPTAQLTLEVLREVTPIISILSSAGVLITLITRIK